ncbi:GTP-binding protein [Pleomorphomonas diazotrophica]|uniref:GTP-binding protein n=1 Tax=Pleomorphomonas diazotrophica TaxID=1166257 RepID=A0A1I4RUD8_9HYPH|nr:GTP-binding protein [Pleomorphomonas diazotrophica]PKR88045.1 GTP-binding protein [Pleomorphomonas diazotrophica]SFM55855.1 GTPase, G3E family [Pleomorphomonas diazotrophica]
MPEANRQSKPVIPVTIVTGFLGAGKTSLLNRLVRDPALAGTGFIINEFGEIGIDHLLVEAADDGIVELSSGCLCCTVRGELVTTLENFLRGLDNGRIDTLSRIVIETTGLADPVPVLATLTAHPYLSLRYAVDGVITVVDAVNGARTLNEHEEAVKQVAVADRLVIAKADLPEGAERLPALKWRLTALNPGAPLVDAAAASPDNLLGSGLYDPATKTADVRRWLNAEAFDAAGEHRHDHDCAGGACDHPSHHHHGEHHHHHHDEDSRHDGVSAFSLVSDNALPAGALEMFLELLRAAHGPKLLRLKGVVRLAEDPDRPLVVHAVQELFHPPVRLPAWPDADRRTRLVFITRDLAEDEVKRLFDAFAGVLAPDTPDRRAMTDNPLALAGFTPPSQRT